MQFQSSLTHLDATTPRGVIKPSTFINGSIFSYHAQVTTIESFSEWLTMIVTQSQKQLERHQKKPDFKDDEMFIWISHKPTIYLEAQGKLNQCHSGNYTSFELWLREEYEKAFIAVENAKNIDERHSDETEAYELQLVRKGSLSDVLTNFVAAVMLDPKQNGSDNQLISRSYQDLATFPPSKWLAH